MTALTAISPFFRHTSPGIVAGSAPSRIIRSGTSPAPNYGEAQTAESAADFIHKLKVALKELRESGIWLRIIAKAHMVKSASLLTPLLHETDELIAIAFTSIQTAKQRKS